MDRSENFYEISHLLKYQRSYSSDPELINRKRITNKPIFISQAVYDILPEEGMREAFLSRLQGKVNELWGSERYEIAFYDILYLNGYQDFRMYKQEYGSVVLMDKEPEPPRHLLRFPEDD